MDDFTNVIFGTAPAASVVVKKPSAPKSTRLRIPTLPCRRPIVGKERTVGEDPRRQYRREVAIPRYLEKKKRRIWEHGLMHESRSRVAFRRARNGGQFSVAEKNN